MSNALGRDIKPGEEVVVIIDSLRPEFRTDPDERVFVCGGGFGMRADTMGTKVYGYWKKQGRTAGEDFIRGYNIDIRATNAHPQPAKEKSKRTPETDPND